MFLDKDFPWGFQEGEITFHGIVYINHVVYEKK